MKESNRSGKMSSRTVTRWGLISCVLAAPVYFVVGHFGGDGRGLAAFIFVGLLVLAIGAFWEFRRQGWFWITIAGLTILHVLVISIIPAQAGKDISGPVLWPVGMVDFAVIFGAIALVKKVMSRGANPQG